MDENNSIKKKNAANIKDLTKQLQILKNKLETCQNSSLAPQISSSNCSSTLGLPPPMIPVPFSNSSSNIPQDLQSKNSRTNSISSLNDKDTIFSVENIRHNDTEDNQSVKSDSLASNNIRFNNQIFSGSNEEDIYITDIDKQKIIEKICKLQKTLAKRNEKIDFLQEHVCNGQFQISSKLLKTMPLQELFIELSR